jgi:hypothetical protein
MCIEVEIMEQHTHSPSQEQELRIGRALTFSFLALSLIPTSGCKKYVATQYRESPAITRGLPLLPKDARLNELVSDLHVLDANLVKFVKEVKLYMADPGYYYLNDRRFFDELEKSIIKVQERIDELAPLNPCPIDRALLLDFSEQVAEARGAMFGAYLGTTHKGELQFDGEGFNEIHGLLGKRRTFTLMIVNQLPPPRLGQEGETNKELPKP